MLKISENSDKHQSVLLQESVKELITDPDGIYIDCTLGYGGHSLEILKHLSPDGKLFAFDLDPDAVSYARENFNDPRFQVFHGNFHQLDFFLLSCGIDKVTGIFADLGVSSPQLDCSARGFSFRADAHLDMRMNNTCGQTAAEALNTLSRDELADIIWKYGEEKASRRIADAIVRFREKKPLQTTGELASIVKKVLGPKKGKTDPATQTFQALRIYLNSELANLETLLKKSLSFLMPGGRIAIISYHSLEDRIVKHFFRDNSQSCICPKSFPICCCQGNMKFRIITKKPVIPSEEEISVNPRSRSAHLRVAEFLGVSPA